MLKETSKSFGSIFGIFFNKFYISITKDVDFFQLFQLVFFYSVLIIIIIAMLYPMILKNKVFNLLNSSQSANQLAIESVGSKQYIDSENLERFDLTEDDDDYDY